MELTQIREMLSQIQTGAQIKTAIGEPVTVGDRVIIPAAEVTYGGGGGGGGGQAPGEMQIGGSGGGGGGGVHVRPMGCWVVNGTEAKWIPAIDYNRAIVLAGGIIMLMLLTARAFARRR